LFPNTPILPNTNLKVNTMLGKTNTIVSKYFILTKKK